MQSAAFDDCVEDRRPLSGLAVSNKEPVFLPNGRRSDGILNGVVVYALRRRRGSPGESPGWRYRSSQKH